MHVREYSRLGQDGVFFRLYQRLWRYASAQEVVSIGESVVVSTLLVLVVDLFWPSIRPLPASTIFLGGFFALAGFTAVRYRWRLVTGLLHRWRRFWQRETQSPSPRQRVLSLPDTGKETRFFVI